MSLGISVNRKKNDDAKWIMEMQAHLDANRNPDHKVQFNILSQSERENYRIPAYKHVVP